MTINKLVAFGVAVVLCMAAAGFGAYLALRPQPAAVPVAAIGEAGVPAAQPAASPANAIAASEALAARGAQAAEAPTATPGAGQKPQIAKSAKPAPAATPAGGSVSGVPAQAPPASENPAGGGTEGAGAPPVADPVQLPVTEPVAPPPPQKVIEELVVSADSVLGLRIESTVSSEVARIEDPVEARVTRDVRVGSEVVIPTGTRVLGSVIQVERGGKMKTAARIGVRFHTLVLADNTRMPIHTEAVYREGKSPGNESAAKVGGAAVGGAILGAILGGGKGAAIGGSVGAAGGTAAVMAGGRNPAMLASGTSLTVRLSQAVTIIIERDETSAR
jgi:hypothetical protein